MINAKTILAVAAIALGATSMAAPSYAGGFGASPLGQDPDFVFTLAEREQWQRLRREGKIKRIYAADHNRGLALEADRFFDEREGLRKKSRKKYR